MHQLSSGLTVGLLVSGGRVRVPIYRYGEDEDDLDFLVYSERYQVFVYEPLPDQSTEKIAEFKRLVTVYGSVSMEINEDNGHVVSVLNIPAAELEHYKLEDLSFPDETGWIESVCRYEVNEHDGLALIHNGILYPLINEVDPSAGDEEKTVDEVLTKSDNVLAPLGQMIATPDRFLSVGAVSSPWGEVESGLHQDSPLEVSALVINDNDAGNISLESFMIKTLVIFPLPNA